MSGLRRRALVVALVATLGAAVGIAGAGHAYLREWRRAAAWFSFVLGAGLVLVSVFADPRSITPTTLPPEALYPVLGLLVLSAADAVRVAVRSSRPSAVGPRRRGDETDESPSCPHCGRSLDPSLAFCWYCAEPAGDESESEADADAAGTGLDADEGTT